MKTVLELLRTFAEEGKLDLLEIFRALHLHACENEERVAELEAQLTALRNELGSPRPPRAAAPTPPPSEG